MISVTHSTTRARGGARTRPAPGLRRHLRRLHHGRSATQRRRERRCRQRDPARPVPQHPPARPPSVSGSSTRPPPPHTPVSGRHQLDPLGRLAVPGDRGGHASGPARTRSWPGTSAPGRSSSSRPGTRPARAGPARGAVRVDRAARVHVRVDQRGQRARAPAAPGPGRGASPTGTTGPAGTRSPRRPRRPRPAGARPPPPARAARPAGGATAAVRNPVTAGCAPPRPRPRCPLPERAARGQLVGVTAAEGVADRPAAQQPVDLRARRLLGEVGEARPAPSTRSARRRRPRRACPRTGRGRPGRQVGHLVGDAVGRGPLAQRRQPVRRPAGSAAPRCRRRRSPRAR